MVFLMPREEKFFDMFDEFADLLVSASQKLLDLVTVFDNLPERAEELRKQEHAADVVVEQIIRALDRSFITPFDREDIHTLATSLDDVVENIEETAQRLVVFRIERPTAEHAEMAQIIHDCCTQLATALRLCRHMKELERLEGCLREVTRLENEADRIYRNCEAELFREPPEILTLIKLRELYAWMEDTVDSCRHAAHIISEIVIKGA